VVILLKLYNFLKYSGETRLLAGTWAHKTSPQRLLMAYGMMIIILEFVGKGPGNTFLQKKGFPGKIFLKITSLERALFSDHWEAVAALGRLPDK
jgi:hypothetical protein